MLLVLAGGRWMPRFWCRYLCLAGALMALCAWRPMIRRRVTDDCIDCGRCVRHCPMCAIDDDPRSTTHHECIVCQTCRRVCPTEAVVLERVVGIKVPVPFVIENRCSGCGYCEHHCPVEAMPAIIVELMEALRLAEGSYKKKDKSVGLSLELKRKSPPIENGQSLLPLNGNDAGSGLPPGFSE